MKKTKLTAALLLTALTLMSSCSTKEEQDYFKNAETTINRENATLYVYKDEGNGLNNINSHFSFSNIDDLPSEVPDMTGFFFNCSGKEKEIPTDVLNRMYSYCLKDRHVFIMFYHANDFSFLDKTDFGVNCYPVPGSNMDITYIYNNGSKDYINYGNYGISGSVRTPDEYAVGCFGYLLGMEEEER